jgi:hypothetical protein
MTKKLTVMLSAASTAVITGFLLISTPTHAVASTDCSVLKGCERKFCEIERQLEIARENDNESRAEGLKIALDEAKNNCTEKNLRENLDKELEEAKDEMAEYESDLKEAKEDGKADKIRKYQGKIKEEKLKITNLEKERFVLD